MKPLLATFVLAVGLLMQAAGGDWRAELTPAPGAFAPMRPLHATYKFGWALLTAAEADVNYTVDKGVGKLSGNAHTTGAVRLTWKMDAVHQSTLRTGTLQPIAMAQTETYKAKKVDTQLTFSPDGVKRLRQVTPAGPEPAKEKDFDFAPLYDLHSALQFIRSQRLQTGDVYKLVVYPTSTPYLAHVTIGPREKVKAGGKAYAAVKLELKLWKIGKDLQLENHEKFKKLSGWFSDDADRLLLRLESEIFVGSVWAELEKVEFK